MAPPTSTAGRWQGQDWNLGSLAGDWHGHLADWTGIETHRLKVRCDFHTHLAQRAALRVLAE